MHKSEFVEMFEAMCHSEEQSDEESLLGDMLLLERFFAYAQNDIYKSEFIELNSIQLSLPYGK